MLRSVPQPVYQAVFYAALLTVFILSLLPVGHPDFSPNDKVNHLFAYLVLMVLGFLAHRKPGITALKVVLFGVLIELLQGLTGYRLFSLLDIVANSCGVLAGYLLVRFTPIKKYNNTGI
ncbi:VanZ family protein [Reinekea marinisedimentorum]|uniref:VanZ like protein n=1 Tax=Reinekea marinisedimentorum TaxID=230495 RepID=A0A4R3I8S6_9GAMM|nr:VanZ family protein [Reinekea marinisedimentorum]TCS42673.1 VanZ like protein [Reinekea marinisedimentorum]